MEHTKGPWKIVGYGGINNCIVPESAIPDNGGLYQSGEYICTVHDALYKKQRANARLIAAAPELLEALNLCIIDAYQKLSRAERLNRIKYAETVVAKAEGRP